MRTIWSNMYIDILLLSFEWLVHNFIYKLHFFYKGVPLLWVAWQRGRIYSDMMPQGGGNACCCFIVTKLCDRAQWRKKIREIRLDDDVYRQFLFSKWLVTVWKWPLCYFNSIWRLPFRYKSKRLPPPPPS